jgi:hypothetical protein
MSNVGYFSLIAVDSMGSGIFPFLDTFDDLKNLSQSCRFFRKIIFSAEVSSFWDRVPVDICIDGLCEYDCGRRKIFPTLAWRILQLTPVECARIHMPFSNVEHLIKLIAENKSRSMKRLYLRFRNAEEVIESSHADSKSAAADIPIEYYGCSESSFCMKELTVYGWPAASVTACRRLMQLTGASLESLQFKETAPVGFLAMASEYCPKLTQLYVQGPQHLEELLNYESDSLVELCLHDSGFKLSTPLKMPHLQKFEMIGRLQPQMIWSTVEDVLNGIRALPQTIKDLLLRIESQLANVAIIEISRRLHSLEMLSLQLPDGQALPADVTLSSIHALKEGCRDLVSLEITDG